MTGVILSGGASRRMGQAKAWLEVGGRACIARVWDACRQASLEPEFQGSLPDLASAFGGAAVHPDPEAGQGPLAALAAAMERHAGEGLLLLACDMPFLSPALLRGIAAGLDGADWAAPEAGGRLHPLCAAYGPAALPQAQELLAAGRRDMHALLTAPGLRGRRLAVLADWGDPDVLVLNVNTPEDLERARRLAAG